MAGRKNDPVQAFLQAVQQAREITGGWLCIRAYSPFLQNRFPVTAKTGNRAHYHPYCRLCQTVSANARCEAYHTRDMRAFGEPRVSTCWAGVTEATVPVEYGGVVHAVVMLGGYRRLNFCDLCRDGGPASRLAAAGTPGEKAAEAYDSLPLLSEERALAAAARLLFLALAGVLGDLMPDGGLPEENTGRYAAQVRNIVQDSLSSAELSVNGVANRIGVSREHLSRCFRTETGETLIAYIQKARCSRACLLLENTAIPIQRVAERSGYPDPSYFSRVFRARMGITPEEYRQSRRVTQAEI